MRRLLFRWELRRFLVFVLMLSANGCAQSDPLASPNAVTLRRVACVYLDYAAAKGGGPANDAQLLAHAKNVALFDPLATGSDPLAGDAPLISQRDGEALVIRYGVRVSLARGLNAPPIAFENSGMNGTRLVAFANGKVACVDENELLGTLGPEILAKFASSGTRQMSPSF
jgi:hypothetical protein